MEYTIQFQKLCQFEGRRYVLIVGMVSVTYLMLQSLILPFGDFIKPVLPDNKVLLSVKTDFPSRRFSNESENESEFKPLNLDVEQGISDALIVHDLNGKGKLADLRNGTVFQERSKESDTSIQDNVLSEKNIQDVDFRFTEDNNDETEILAQVSVDIVAKNRSIHKSGDIVSSNFDQNGNVKSENRGNSVLPEILEDVPESDLALFHNGLEVKSENRGIPVLPEIFEDVPESDLALFHDELENIRSHRKKSRDGFVPPLSVTSVDKMNQILAHYLASSMNTKRDLLSVRDRDKEILDAKLKIINSSASHLDKELYAPVFRNVSMFMRSYELMEQTLKVYVYKDGKRPIFHQPILKGLYASEGWFMKLMEGNKRFVVKRPEKAHLFYMPFSSRELEHTLYLPNSHNMTSLTEFVKHYKETIAARYPFWNQTRGRDHFFVACHDWAPLETMEHMNKSIKALCNADVTIGFRIGKDVSLPETFIRYARNPLRYRGGKPPSERNILAFYAGNIHGYLRPILLKYWKNKDPDMKIYGLLPSNVSRKMNYIQHMKSSKYCICPKGFEVNSPRVVEAIFYECVPVIISDNFVPPFFEVLNWEAFSVIVAEKDFPNLKKILVSMPEKKYMELQMGVKKVQQHFLWHAKPVKYDLFHMILHSIWFSRVFQM